VCAAVWKSWLGAGLCAAAGEASAGCPRLLVAAVTRWETGWRWRED